jgi:hypothetical protein
MSNDTPKKRQRNNSEDDKTPVMREDGNKTPKFEPITARQDDHYDKTPVMRGDSPTDQRPSSSPIQKEHINDNSNNNKYYKVIQDDTEPTVSVSLNAHLQRLIVP